MKVGLKTTITQLPKKGIEGINEIGASTRGILKSGQTWVKGGVDKFVQTKVGSGLKKAGINKDTAIGVALIALAVTKAIQIGVNIKNRVDESRETLKQ